MPVALREALRVDGGARSHRTLVWSVGLALVVVVVAGTVGTGRLSGPRWSPNLRITSHRHAPTPPRSEPRLKPQGAHALGRLPLGAILLWTAIAIGVLGVVWLLSRWVLGRRSPSAADLHVPDLGVAQAVAVEPEPELDAPVLRNGIEQALRVLDEAREPSDAIVRAWLGLEETAEQSGIVRGAAETPTEFTARIMRRALADDSAMQILLGLYLRTRFGDHPASSEDVAAVRAALNELSRSWSVADAAIDRRARSL